MLWKNRGEGKFGIIVLILILSVGIYIGFKWGFAPGNQVIGVNPGARQDGGDAGYHRMADQGGRGDLLCRYKDDSRWGGAENRRGGYLWCGCVGRRSA